MRSQTTYLLDTNVLSALGKPIPDPAVFDWVASAPRGSLAIAWSTVFELQFGIEKARRAGSRHADAYERDLRELLRNPTFRILRPTTEAARIRARMHATPELRGFITAHPGARRQPTGEDLTIAATAIVHRAVIVTANVRDFVLIERHFGLPGVFDPARGRWVVAPADVATPPKSTRAVRHGLRFCPTARWAPYPTRCVEGNGRPGNAAFGPPCELACESLAA